MKKLLILLVLLSVSCGTTKNLTSDDHQKIAEIAIDELGLDVEVEIVDLDTSKMYIQPNSEVKAVVGGSGHKKYKIKLLSRLTTSTAIQVISHEVWHIKQYESGDFSVISARDAMFKGRVIKRYHQVPYSRRPWEIEAHIEGRKLSSKVRKRWSE